MPFCLELADVLLSWICIILNLHAHLYLVFTASVPFCFFSFAIKNKPTVHEDQASFLIAWIWEWMGLGLYEPPIYWSFHLLPKMRINYLNCWESENCAYLHAFMIVQSRLTFVCIEQSVSVFPRSYPQTWAWLPCVLMYGRNLRTWFLITEWSLASDSNWLPDGGMLLSVGFLSEYLGVWTVWFYLRQNEIEELFLFIWAPLSVYTIYFFW